MLVDQQCVDGAQALAGALPRRLGGEGSIKNAGKILKRNTSPVTFHVHNHLVVIMTGAQGNLAMPLYGFSGVTYQVGPELVKLTAIDLYCRQALIVLSHHPTPYAPP